MYSTQKDENSRFKLAQLWHFANRTDQQSRKTYLHNLIVNSILKDHFDINYKVTIDSEPYLGSKIHLKDCTALHFLFYKILDIDTFTALIERGADFTIKNGNGQTVLHLIMTECRSYSIENEIPFINSVLSAHVKFQNSANPHDDNGFSHLHAACMTNHVEALKLFLENGASIDEAVNINAPQFAGYTPLHFAAVFHSYRVAQVLVSRGANINAQNADGTSPLDLLIEHKRSYRSLRIKIPEKEKIIKLLLEKGGVSTVGSSSLHVACTLNDLTFAKGLLDRVVNIDYAVPMESPLCPGYTALHFAAYNSIEAVEMLLKRGAKIDITNAERLTPLEVCINKYGLQDVCNILSCIENWTEICLSDGETRLLDLIATMGNSEQFTLFLQNKTKDISAAVPRDSILWPGYTILHLAVMFANEVEYDTEIFEQQDGKTIVEECLNYGLDVNVPDVRGQTPIHLAFRLDKEEIVKVLLEHLDRLDQLVDLVDEDNLSYLHIVCAIEDDSLVEKLLSISDPNIAYKNITNSVGLFRAESTPLHAAATNGSHTIAEILLRHGANLHATDANGMTPIHRLLKFRSPDDQEIANVLFGSLLSNPQDRVVDGLGLSYLHISCHVGNVEASQKLLDLGSNVNAVIKCDECSANHISRTAMACLERYSNYTPLQLAVATVSDPNEQVLDLLLRRGADIFVQGSDKHSKHSSCIPIQNKHVIRRFCHVLWDQDDMQKYMEERFGLTKLHIACYIKNEEAIRSLLNDGIDINTQVHADSVIFSGCTPLHLLITTSASLDNDDDIEYEPLFDIETMIKLLLDHKADVTIANIEKDTSIHVLFKQGRVFLNGDRCKDLLLNAQQDFSVNPVNAEGLSHLHLACRWHKVEVVEKFLHHSSVDVNRPIDCFARSNAGCTPLHLALKDEKAEPNDLTKLLQTVDLLLKYGADVAAKDIRGNTPLHKAASLRSPEISILDKIVSYGGDVKSENIRGQTPIEELMDVHQVNTNPTDNVTIFQKYGYKINSWNHFTGEGFIAKIFVLNNRNLSENYEFEKFTKSSDVRTIDYLGRTAIHNSVAISKDLHSEQIQNYIYAFDSFIKIGIDIDQQDKLGQTALHYAVRMENITGVEGLLACGADVNIVDNSGKTAFSSAMEQSKNKNDLCYSLDKNVMKVLRLHIKKLQHLRIEVSQLNQNLINGLEHIFDRPIYTRYERNNFNNLSQRFFSQIEVTKTLDMETISLTLFDFLSETGAVNLYPYLLRSEQDSVDDFFNSINFNELKELTGIIKLQFKKMRTRLELIDSALSSLRTLLGFSVAGLCEQISRFLLNSDLKNLIESTSKTRKRKRCISTSS